MAGKKKNTDINPEESLPEINEMIVEDDDMIDDFVDELDEEITAITDNAIGRLDGVLNSTIGYITVPSERYAFFPESGERASTGSNWYTSLIARATGA